MKPSFLLQGSILVLSFFFAGFLMIGCAEEEKEENNNGESICEALEEYLYVLDACVDDAAYVHELETCWYDLEQYKPTMDFQGLGDVLFCAIFAWLFPNTCWNQPFGEIEGCDFNTACLDECVEGSNRAINQCRDEAECVKETMDRVTDCLLACVEEPDDASHDNQ